ncbi:MAG: aminotransferase class III-fold pyridoxal phosphate-dependent enzyme, partial [Chloroflexota bacterium]|nr:aminotransferase class III-fold pyridoxal phosphate-dependent enzyme [Chloroflexota bacterium]
MIGLDELRQRVEGEYYRRTPRSRVLHERAQAWLPGGETRTGTAFAPYPTYMDRGEGNYLYDVDGSRLLDFTNNSTSLIHGHAHSALVRAIREQAARGTGWHAPHELQARLARLLCERVPSLERVRFCNSGTEANMNAIKAARAFTGRDRIVKTDSAYHGSYEGVEFDGAGDSANGAAPAMRPTPTSRGVPRSMAENVLTMPFDDCDAARRLVARHRHELAAVLVNPIVTRAGLHLPSPGYLGCLREVARDNDVLLIFDEVITLRIARGGAQDYYGVVPDLTAMGKIVGGGLPVGAFGGRADIMEVFATGDPPLVPHSGTF